MRCTLRRRQAGVSLIEALVAFAVLGFGMLAIAGMQTSMRFSADTAKQRAEAVRLAQAAIEDTRSFGAIAGLTARADDDYAAIAGFTQTNTTYELRYDIGTGSALNTVNDATLPGLRSLQVDVRWLDRTGVWQSVRFMTAVGAVAPELTASLALPPGTTGGGQLRGRHAAIPPEAVWLGSERSAFRPPQPPTGTVAWQFNNTSGLVTSICTIPVGTTNATLTSDSLSNCQAVSGQVVRGFVRFATDPLTVPTAAVAENPTGTPWNVALNLDLELTLTSTGHPAPGSLCFDDAPAASAPTQEVVSYHCLVYLESTQTSWSGRTDIQPRAFDPPGGPAWTIAASGADSYKVCRYTTLASDTGPNPQHPATYVDVTRTQVLADQNFLVISAQWSCPSDVEADPLAGDYVNSNTRQHQPAT